jgi:hypothetical protein
MSTLLRLACPDLPFVVVIEDDDRVCYAYLLSEENIVGDVWLYNRLPAPSKPEWRDPSKAPFANPSGFTTEEDAFFISDERNVNVKWVKHGETLEQVELFLDNRLLAVLAPGAKPGWCRNAKKSGPLARVLEDTYGDG